MRLTERRREKLSTCVRRSTVGVCVYAKETDALRFGPVHVGA